MASGTYDEVLTTNVEAHIKYRACEGATRYLVWIIIEHEYNKKKMVIAVAHPRPVKYLGGRFLGKKSREFPSSLVPAGRFPVVAGSRRKFSRGGRFPYNNFRAFPWWLFPAGRVHVMAMSRSNNPVNSGGG